MALERTLKKKLTAGLCCLTCSLTLADDNVTAGENPSNPLSKGRNTDLRAQYFDLGDGADRSTYNLEGSLMLHSQLKIKYEARYWSTDVTGEREHGMEATSLKAIYFAKDGRRGNWGLRGAIGLEWIYDFDNGDKGIGGGSNFLSPFIGIALSHSSGLTLIPLIQHFSEYSGNKANATAFRLIGMKPLDGGYWLKLDAKVPVDWENDNAIPANVELQLGKMFSPGLGAYVDGFAGVGSDRPYDWGLGLGLRYVY